MSEIYLEEHMIEETEDKTVDMGILDSILNTDDLTGRSCIVIDLKSQSKDIYSLKESQISEIADTLRKLPTQSVRVYSRISQRLVILLSVYYKYSHMLNINLDDLKILLEYAPWGDMLETIEKYGEFYRFHQLESGQVSYLSGIMLDKVSIEYHEKFHRENIDRLYRIQLPGLLYFTRAVHRNILSNLILTTFLDQTLPLEEHMSNTTDSVGDKLEDYFPFDVVYYVDEDKKICGIARTEFDYILKQRENPYNRKSIPLDVLAEIEKRDHISRILSLGNCQTVENIWKSILSPKLTYEQFVPRIQKLLEKSRTTRMPIFNRDTNPFDIMFELARYHDENDLMMVQPENGIEAESSNNRSRRSPRRTTRRNERQSSSIGYPYSPTINSNNSQYSYEVDYSNHPIIGILSSLAPAATF